MADQTETQPIPTLQPDDWLLTAFVRQANAGRGETGVTLMVGGQVVSGVIVSGREYLEGMGRALDAESSNTNSTAWSDLYGKLADDFYPPQPESEPLSEEFKQRPIS